MAYKAGDITEITFNHPTIGSGRLFPKANESGTIDRGGFRNNDDANQIAGDGQMIIQKNRVRGSFEIPIAWDMVSADEQQKLVNLANEAEPADWTITSISGAVWAERGIPVGDLQADTNTGIMTLKIAFENELRVI